MSQYEDLPKGPLDTYRKNATFDWKKLKNIFEEDIEYSNIKMNVWKTLASDPIFLEHESCTTTSELKKMAAKKLHRYLQFDILPKGILTFPYKKRLKFMMAVNEALAMALPDVSVKHGIGVGVIKNILATLGTERHKPFLDALWTGKVVGCIALTEVAHGSNTKLMKTTAEYDARTRQFILNTPDFKAAKCWSGNLGKTATFGIVFAQLLTNSENYGLHAFVVPLRDPSTLVPYHGLVIGDMGEKIGLHGIDNGFVMFENYKIPKENLLNRIGDVNDEGEYESCFSEPGKLLGASLENLALPRVGIMFGSVNSLIKAVTVAVRYGAVRRQFSENGTGVEIPIIEYPLHQWRLFPHVSAAAVFKIFTFSLFEDYLNVLEKSMKNSDRLEEINDFVSEVHSIISASKPLLTWKTRDAIQECREACGGHGYLKASGLGDLRNDHDPTVTYEGDNNVLQQQTSNWLLKQYTNLILNGAENVSSPLNTASFLQEFTTIKSKKYNDRDDFKNPKYLMECYEWLVIYLLEEVSKAVEVLEKRGVSKFSIRTQVQVYKCSVLTKVYIELTVQRYFWRKVFELNASDSHSTVLFKLGLLYGLCSLDSHVSYFYQGGFCNTPGFTIRIKENILKLCEELKPDIVAVIDALAPPDCILNSILGKSDGKIYEHLKRSFFKARGDGSRPEWWSEVVFKDVPNVFKCKL